MKLGNLQGAHQYLVAFEKHTKNDPSCRIAIARLAKLRGDSEKLFTQLNRAFEENLLLIPEDLTVDYLKKCTLPATLTRRISIGSTAPKIS